MKIIYQVCFICVVSFFLLSACENLPLDAAVRAQDGQVEESPLARSLTRPSGRISVLGNDGNIYTLDQTGDKIIPITADAKSLGFDGSRTIPEVINYLLPTWSTSGQKLAYAQQSISSPNNRDFAAGPSLQTVQNQVQERPETVTTYSILSVNADGKQKEVLWSGTARPIYMYWSPDGTELSALLQEGQSPNLRLTLLPAGNASNNPLVLDIGSPMFWDWSQNGKQIVTHIGSNGLNERIALIDLSEPLQEEILNFNPMPFMSPDISPDGTLLTLPIRADDETDDDTWVAVYDLEDRSRRIIDRLDGDNYISQGFSPDGQSVAYIASKSSEGVNRGELVVFALATGERLISDEKNIAAFFWAPDSKKIAFIESVRNNDDGSRSLKVIDVETGIVSVLIEAFETTSEFNEVIAFFSQYQRSATIWAPDSQHIVVPALSSEGAEIKVVHASGKVLPQTVALGTLAFWSTE